ncbi:MAG: monofunctional biosynthetic peptidoglycan transglycosylase [Hyphomicrobiaceae bacterium]
MDASGAGDGNRDRDVATGRPGEPPWSRTARTLPVTGPVSGSVAERAAATGRRPRPQRNFVWRWLRRLLLLGLTAVIGLLGLVVVYRFAVPGYTPTMLYDLLSGGSVEQTWVPLSRVSPRLVRAVVASEDGRFCTHHGVDLGELKAAIEEARSGSPRGASTISMQLVKNLFLWQGRSYVRKAIELPLTLWLELVWPKKRIMEVYLNIAEWGPGIYGIEAASRHAFGKPASRLTADEAALLAVVLPSPSERDAANPDDRHVRIARIIAARARGPINTGCLD